MRRRQAGAPGATPPSSERQVASAADDGRRLPPWSALCRTLGRDRFVQAAAGLLALFAVLYLLPQVSSEERQLLSRPLAPFVFLLLVVAALLGGLASVARHEERQFWRELAFAFACWVAATLLFLFFPRYKPLAVRWAAQLLFALHYIALLLAVESHPHRRHRWRSRRLERALTWPPVAVFIFGMFAYFTLIPLLLDRAEYDSYMPSMCLFAALDAFVAAKLFFLWRSARVPRWQVIYALLATSMALNFLNDAVGAVGLGLGRSVGTDAPWGFLLHLPYVLVVLAARSRQADGAPGSESKVAEDRLEEALPGPTGQTMIAALVFPFIHFACYSLGVLRPASRPEREFLVGWTLLMLATIAFIQHRLLERRSVALWREHMRTAEALRNSEQDLRLIIERKRAHDMLRESETRFLQAFHASPDVIILIALEDGRFIEVNDSFEQASGYSRAEVLGRTGEDLGFWPDSSKLRQVVERLRTEGAVADTLLRFRTRAGDVRTARFASETIELEGRACVLATAYDVTEEHCAELGVLFQAELLDRAHDAFVLLDQDARVIYWNRGAELLYGWTPVEALGRAAGGFLFREGSPAHAAARRAVEEKGSFSGELSQLTKGGEEIRVAARWTRVDGEAGERPSILGTSTRVAEKHSVSGFSR